MDTLLGRYKNVLVFVGVMLLQLIALAVEVRTPSLNGDERAGDRLLRHWIVGLVAPPEKAVVSTGSETRGLWGSYIDLRHVREENQKLRDEVYQLRLEQAGLLEDARQGERLQALLGFREHYISQTVPAQVIGTAGSEEARVLYIDKGSQDGVETEQPVITPDGIVGKIKEVFPHTAQVLEINDQTSGAGVLLQKTRLRGVLRGNMYGQPQIINILPDERIQPGEPVVTSGGDQIFPRGLPVGTVEKVVTDPERDPYVDVVIKPAANLSRLEEVLVVTGTSATLPAKEQRDLAHSQAVGAAEEDKQRASDILAEKLPGLVDPNAADAGQIDSGEQKSDGEEVGRPIQPPQPLHADRFSPNSVLPAAQLTPGKAPFVARPEHSAEEPESAPHVKPVSSTSVRQKPLDPAKLQREPDDSRPEMKAAVGAAAASSIRTSATISPAHKPATQGADARKPDTPEHSPRDGSGSKVAPGEHAQAGVSPATAKPATAKAPDHGKPGSTPRAKSSYVEPKWVGKRDLPQEKPE